MAKNANNLKEDKPKDLFVKADPNLAVDILANAGGPPTAGLQSEEHLEAPYTFYRWTNTYSYKSGLEQIPLASASGASRFVRLHQPIIQRIWRWEAKRRSQWPNVPAPVPRDDNEVLLAADITPAAPDTEDAQTAEYFISGVYVFGLSEPVWVVGEGNEEGAALPAGSMPWTTLPVEDQAVPAARFVEGLI